MAWIRHPSAPEKRLIYRLDRVDRDLFPSSESGESLSRERERERERRKGRKLRRQLRGIPRHVRVYVLSFDPRENIVVQIKSGVRETAVRELGVLARGGINDESRADDAR